MRPEAETMKDRELLMELVEDKRRQEKLRYIKYGIAAAVIVLIVVLLLVYLPPVVRTFDKIDGAVDMMQSEMDNISGSFDEAMEKLSEFEALADKLSVFEELGDKISEFEELGDKLKGLEELGDKLGEIDFEAFNEVISKLNNLVNKFPWLFK